jgi:hypothetical protein
MDIQVRKKRSRPGADVLGRGVVFLGRAFVRSQLLHGHGMVSIQYYGYEY